MATDTVRLGQLRPAPLDRGGAGRERERERGRQRGRERGRFSLESGRRAVVVVVVAYRRAKAGSTK
jgi:hypothetical protein